MIDNTNKDKLLADYLHKHLTTPFGWGTFDCVIFTVGWLELLTGNKYLPKITWTDAKSAMKVIKKEYKSLEHALDKELKRIHPNMAQDGDVTLHNNTMFIFSGSHIVSVGEAGLVYLKRTEVKECAWRYTP